MAIPGSIVASGKLVTPGGAAGPLGATGPNAVSADAGNLATLGSDNLISVPSSGIWGVRLRSFNAVGNPNFEVCQRNIGNLLTNPPDNSFVEDRWNITKNAATFGYSVQSSLTSGILSPVLLPGTNFGISQRFIRITLTAQQATLATNQCLQLTQTIEGPGFRELSADVHSISLLVRSSVAGQIFTLALRDAAATATQSLIKLCTISTANVWTLISLPNLPIWPSGGTYIGAPGGIGYLLTICLASGPTLTAPAANTWMSGNFVGAPGMSNFAASPVNSTFDLAFVQHESGSVCSTLMDKTFTDNLQECQRYFQKTVPYTQGVNTASSTTVVRGHTVPGGTVVRPNFNFPVELAKTSTTNLWSPTSGTSGKIYLDGPGEVFLSAFPAATTRTMGNIVLTASQPALYSANFDYSVDTGW